MYLIPKQNFSQAKQGKWTRVKTGIRYHAQKFNHQTPFLFHFFEEQRFLDGKTFLWRTTFAEQTDFWGEQVCGTGDTPTMNPVRVTAC